DNARDRSPYSAGMARMRPAAALSLFYASSFAFLGLYLPYFNLYLDRLGMSGLQIGTVSAILPLCGVLMPAAGGWLADRLGRMRAWGSFAFIAAALLATPVVGAWGDGSVLWLILIPLVGAIGAALLLPADTGRPAEHPSVRRATEVLKRPDVIRFLAACVLSQ